MKKTVLAVVWLLQNRIGPILPFKPMRGFRDPHRVSGHLRIELGGDRYTRRAGDRGRPQPPRDTADVHEIRHHVVARPARQRPVKVAGAVEILADLDRGLQFGRKLDIAVEIVVHDRLFDPGQTEVVDGVAAQQGFAEIEALG